MKNLSMYCITLDPKHEEKINALTYIPVGLGNNKFSDTCLSDKTGDNICSKNPFYGEYTFHYWLWKNNFMNIEDGCWIGFCTYRRFWKNKIAKSNNLKHQIISEIPEEWNNYDVILANKIDLTNVKWIKVLKYGKKAFFNNPKSILKKYRNIKFQFDMFHGNGVLEKAINVLNENDREDFRLYVTKNRSFNPFNMFICKSKKLTNQYYKTIFEWFENCEKIFGFNLKGYGQIRLYAFLAERFMPFWFNKYARCLDWPIVFKDLREENLD